MYLQPTFRSSDRGLFCPLGKPILVEAKLEAKSDLLVSFARNAAPDIQKLTVFGEMALGQYDAVSTGIDGFKYGPAVMKYFVKKHRLKVSRNDENRSMILD